MENKRGQLTIFIIVAVAIIVLVLVFYFGVFRNTQTRNENDAKAIKAYITDSIETRIINNILLVSNQGGYGLVPDEHFLTPFYQVGFWVNGNETFYPSLTEIEGNINYLNYLLGDIDLNTVFPGYNITTGALHTNTTILPEKVIVSIDWPITIRKGNSVQTLDKFDYTYNIRLGRLYNEAAQVAEAVANRNLPENINPEFNLTIYQYDDASLYEIKDTNKNYGINNEYFTLVFAGK